MIVFWLRRPRHAVDCDHFAYRDAAERVVVQESEAVRLQRDVPGRGEGRPHHDCPVGRQGCQRIALRHQRLVGNQPAEKNLSTMHRRCFLCRHR